MTLISKNRRRLGKVTNMWESNHMLLSDQRVNEETTREIRKCFQMSENENIV